MFKVGDEVICVKPTSTRDSNFDLPNNKVYSVLRVVTHYGKESIGISNGKDLEYTASRFILATEASKILYGKTKI